MSERRDLTSSDVPDLGDEKLTKRDLASYLASSREYVRTARESLERHPHRYAVGALTLLFATAYAIAGIVEHEGYRTALLDLGIYDQALREYAAFHLPRVPLFGVRTPDHAGLLHWTDHFTPILAILTPLYWVYDRPASLIVAHGALFGLAIPPIWLFARRALGTGAAYLVAVAFGLAWPIQKAVWIPFHQVAFAVPLLAAMLERYQAGRYRQAAVLAALLLGVREDLGLVVSTLGVFLWARKQRVLGPLLTLSGVGATALITGLVIPLLGGSPRRNWSYSAFGNNPSELLWTMLSSPLATLEYALTPATKVRTLLWLLGPLLFLSLRSSLFLFAVPLLAIRFLSTEANYFGTDYHYNAYVIPILFCAAVDGAGKLPNLKLDRRKSLRLGTAWAFAICAIAIGTLPRWPGWSMTHRAWWYPRTEAVHAAERAIAQIPKGAFVAAVNNAGIHFTHRAKVLLWVPAGDRRGVEAVWTFDRFRWRYLGDRRLAEADWVLADTERQQFPFRSLEQQREAVELLLQRGYSVQYEDGGFVVLRRSD